MFSAPTTEQLLDFTVLSSRGEGVTLELLDADLVTIGELHPMEPAVVAIDTTQRTTRRLTNLHLTPSDTSAVDVRSELVRPSWKLSNGVLFPLGVFAFENPIRRPHSWGTESQNTLTDMTLFVDQPAATTVSFPQGLRITDVLASYVPSLLDTPFVIVGSETRFGQAALYPPATSQYQILLDCTTLLGYLPPYFDNTGALIFRPVPVLTGASTPFVYGPGTTVEADSISEPSALLTAPNRYIVVGGGFTSSDPIIGVFDIPSGAPNSIYNRGGRVVATTISLQSVSDPVAAYVAAKAAYAKDPLVESVDFDAVTDPRHDTFDVVEYRGTNMLEVGASIELRFGGKHHHTLRNLYE